MVKIIFVVAYLILAPVIGGLLAGMDRIISARMQSKVGPPLLQPFYDVLKLLEKERITVNNAMDFYVGCFLLFVVVTGCFFFAGMDLLLVIFTLTLASVFLIVAAFSTGSAYPQLGAERELLQMMAYEPMVLITAIGFYIFNGSFNVSSIVKGAVDINGDAHMAFPYMIGIFVGFREGKIQIHGLGRRNSYQSVFKSVNKSLGTQGQICALSGTALKGHSVLLAFVVNIYGIPVHCRSVLHAKLRIEILQIKFGK